MEQYLPPRHASAHTRMHTHTRTHRHTRIHAHAHTHNDTPACTHTHTHTQRHKAACTRTQAHIKRTHARAHINIHAPTHKNTHAHTHARTQKLASTRMLITEMCSGLFPPLSYDTVYYYAVKTSLKHMRRTHATHRHTPTTNTLDAHTHTHKETHTHVTAALQGECIHAMGWFGLGYNEFRSWFFHSFNLRRHQSAVVTLIINIQQRFGRYFT